MAVQRWVWIGGFALGVGLGVGVLNYPRGQAVPLAAAPVLSAPLNDKQQRELLNAMLLVVENRLAEAVPTLFKYAMMGEPHAQSELGSLYLSGTGLPADRQQGIKWLSLAAAQGGAGDQKLLEQAIAGPVEAGSVYVRSQSSTSAAQSTPDDNFFSVQRHGSMPNETTTGPWSAIPPVPVENNGSRLIDRLLNDESAVKQFRSRISALDKADRYSDASASASEVRAGTPVILNPAGPGQYSGSNGDMYSRAGPHGAVNERTGEFTPTN